jgi:hypothetical protein
MTMKRVTLLADDLRRMEVHVRKTGAVYDLSAIPSTN